MPDTEVQKGQVQSPGGAEQLPQGAAAQVNDALSQVRDPAPVEYADEGYQPAQFKPGDEAEQILFAEPDQPKPVGGRISTRPSQRPVPNQVIAGLPLMKAMAMDPKAPPAVKMAYYGILQRLEQEQNQ